MRPLPPLSRLSMSVRAYTGVKTSPGAAGLVTPLTPSHLHAGSGVVGGKVRHDADLSGIVSCHPDGVERVLSDGGGKVAEEDDKGARPWDGSHRPSPSSHSSILGRRPRDLAIARLSELAFGSRLSFSLRLHLISNE